MNSVDPAAAAVLLAKRIVQQAQQRGAARDRTEADSVRTSVGATPSGLSTLRLRRSLGVRGRAWRWVQDAGTSPHLLGSSGTAPFLARILAASCCPGKQVVSSQARPDSAVLLKQPKAPARHVTINVAPQPGTCTTSAASWACCGRTRAAGGSRRRAARGASRHPSTS